MKTLILSSITLLFAGAISGRVSAQGQPVAAKEKMKVFASWPGHWQGEGSMQMGPGDPHHSAVDERIESKLDGTVMLIEGIGKSIDPATHKERISHHALGIVSFDAVSGKYKFNSFLQDGRSTDAWLIVVADNRFQWGFETDRGKMRYNITLDPVKKTWNERGEFSTDGNEWKQFFEMNLTKVED